MALGRIACTHFPWIILVLAWKVVSARSFFLLLCGFLLGWASRYLRMLTRYITSPKDDGHLQNFEHGVLNLPLDRYCMWMNMGYWAVSRSLFCLRSHRCGGLMYLLGNGQLRRGM